jgi:hypothetical protein
MTIFLFVLTSVFLLSILFVVAGSIILKKVPLLVNSDFYFETGTSFFIGLALFFTLAAPLARMQIIGTRTALAFSLSVFLFLIWSYKKNFENLSGRKKELTISALVIFVILILGLVRSLVPVPPSYFDRPALVNPFATETAVAHSFRAANLSTYIADLDRLPLLNEHSLMSFLGAIPLTAGINAPQISLALWLAVSLAFFSLAIYGLARSFLPMPLAVIPALFVLLGNTVFSFFYSSITDTGSALLLSSNLETLFGIIIMLVCLLALFRILQEQKSDKKYLALLFSLAFISNLASSQNIILFAIPLFFTLFFPKLVPNQSLIFQTGFVWLAGATLGVFILGGMLLPTKLADHINVPGVMELQKPGVSPIELHFPRTGEGNPHTFQKIIALWNKKDSPQVEISALRQGPLKNSDFKQNKWFFRAAKLGRSVQLVSFPLLGLVLAWILLWHSRERLSSVRYFLTFETSLLFVAGWVASSIFDVYGYHWELSRFLSFGAFAAMFIFGICLGIVYDTSNTKRKVAIISIIIIVLLGPSLETFSEIAGNILSSGKDGQTLSSRFYWLNHAQGIYGSEFK